MGVLQKLKMFLIFCPSSLAYTLYKAVEVNLVLVLGITSLTTPFFSGPPLSPGLRLGQWMRVVGLCSCSVQMNHGLWEGWWKDCTLPQDFIRPGPAFPHSPHFSSTAPTPTAQTLMASSNARFKETFQSFGSALCLCYFVAPPPLETDFT